MKKKLTTVAMTAGLMATSQALAIEEGEVFPDITIEGVEARQLNPDSLKGKVTIINFWATWCEACKVELVEMQDEFAELFKADKFQFMFVSLDKDPEKAKAWVNGHMSKAEEFMQYLYKDPKFSAADVLEVDSFPMTLVIDEKGKVVKVQRGFKEGAGMTEELAKIAHGLLKG